MAQQLAYMILLQALRLHLQEGAARGIGWLFALADPPIRTAMAWMHDAPGHKWTLQGLADCLGIVPHGICTEIQKAGGDDLNGISDAVAHVAGR